MTDYRQIYMDAMDAQGIKYTLMEDGTIRVVYDGNEMNHITIFVSFDPEEEGVALFRSWDIFHYGRPTDPISIHGYIKPHRANCKFRWVTFYMEENAIHARMEALVSPESCGPRCIKLVRLMASIIDDVYPALWVAGGSFKDQ